jgi:hypothetical protein
MLGLENRPIDFVFSVFSIIGVNCTRRHGKPRERESALPFARRSALCVSSVKPKLRL